MPAAPPLAEFDPRPDKLHGAYRCRAPLTFFFEMPLLLRFGIGLPAEAAVEDPGGVRCIIDVT